MSKKPKAYDDLFVAALFLGVGAWVYFDLSAVHNGAIESVKIWAPIAFLYKNLGFGIAVSLLPLLGVFFLLRGLIKVVKPPVDPKEPLDLNISVAELYPESGSVLETEQPIVVKINYQYSKPNENFYIWAKVLDETYDAMYEGSTDALVPGTGTVKRFVYLTEPGQIRKIHIVVKNMDFEEVYKESIDVDYWFEASEKYTAFKDDGLGSKITSITFDKPQGKTLKVGEEVVATLEYDINTAEGLNIWVMPETKCSNSYEGTMGKQSGKGQIQKYFIMGEPCELKKIKLIMKNVVSNTVYEKIIDVNFKFK